MKSKENFLEHFIIPIPFFALYANIDNFDFSEKIIPHDEKPELDRWIISELNTLIKKVDSHYNDYEPTKVKDLLILL